MLFGRSKKQGLESAALAQDAQAEGWDWQQAAPPPSIEMCEAALRGRRRAGAAWASGIQPVWPVGLADAVTGACDGQPFTAGRFAGYAYGTTNSGTVFGHLVQTCAVWLPLPGALPEIRLVDATGTQEDAGIRLPALGSVPPGTRWSVQGFLPAFATDLLGPAFTAALDAAPPCSAIVIRAGAILVYGVEPWEAATIAAWVRTLAGLVEQVPTAAWNRADPLVAGTGVFPYDLRDGGGLRLDQRLVRRDWEGSGLSTFDWQDAASLDGSVVLSGRESVEVHVFRKEDAPPGLTSGVAFTGGSHAALLGIPTVASTLEGRG